MTDSITPNDWMEAVQTGDIILFSGKSYWFSYVVEYLTWSDFSHIGMILRDPTYIDPKLKGLYMLESGTEKFPDAVEHKIKWGVQIVNLKKVVDTYCGRVWIRQLTIPKSFQQNIETVLPQVWQKITDLPYDSNPWDLFRSEFRLNWGDTNRTNDFFCSALVAFLWEQFGFFRQSPHWDLILPKDFDQNGKVMSLLIEPIQISEKTLVFNSFS